MNMLFHFLFIYLSYTNIIFSYQHQSSIFSYTSSVNNNIQSISNYHNNKKSKAIVYLNMMNKIINDHNVNNNDDEKVLQELLYKSYDGNKISNYYKTKPLLVWDRLIEIGSPLLGWYIIKKFENITSFSRTKEENYRLLLNRAKDFRDSIVQGNII